MTMQWKVIEKIKDQARLEIQHDDEYKKGRIKQWNKTEDAYYGRKVAQDDTRANVSLNKMQGFVHTILSKIDSPLSFKFMKGELGDMKKVKILNAMKDADAKAGRWDYKDILGKKSAIMYGRAVYLYLSRGKKGDYESQLSLIDVKDFLIDPDAGGMDVENAKHLGWWNTRLSRKQLQDGADDGTYIKASVKRLLDGSGNNTEETTHDTDKKNRFASYATTRERSLKRDDEFIFYTWFTTYDDERYMLLVDDNGECVRCVKWTEIRKSGRYPIWSWATEPDQWEFWNLGPCDRVREVFQAQEKSVNQSLDNSEQINRPQTAVNVDFVPNLSQVKYRKDSWIEVTGNTDVNKVIATRQTPSIDTPLKLYDKLDLIVQAESGVTAATRGTSEEETLGVYEGNLMQAGDRFGLLNKSYSEGYNRFGVLYTEGVMQDLKKKRAVEVIGSQGLEIHEVTGRDLKPGKRADYDVVVESSATEAQNNLVEQKNKLTFLEKYQKSGFVNLKVLFETEAKIAGLDEDTIKRMLDTSEYGQIEQMAEAEETFQKLLEGKEVPLYKDAMTAYRQRLVDLWDKYDHELTPEQQTAVEAYIEAIGPIVEHNMARSLTTKMAEAGMMQDGQPVPVEGAEQPQDPSAPVLGAGESTNPLS